MWPLSPVLDSSFRSPYNMFDHFKIMYAHNSNGAAVFK